jgi:hypothetical protein
MRVDAFMAFQCAHCHAEYEMADGLVVPKETGAMFLRSAAKNPVHVFAVHPNPVNPVHPVQKIAGRMNRTCWDIH